MDIYNIDTNSIIEEKDELTKLDVTHDNAHKATIEDEDVMKSVEIDVRSDKVEQMSTNSKAGTLIIIMHTPDKTLHEVPQFIITQDLLKVWENLHQANQVYNRLNGLATSILNL